MTRTTQSTRIVIRDPGSNAAIAMVDLGAVPSQSYGSTIAADQPTIGSPTAQAVKVEIMTGGVMTAQSVATYVTGAAVGGGGGGGTAPAITTQPQSATITQGQTATLTVVATGTALGYQWRRDGANISGATAATYGATLGGSYTVVVTNSVGSVTSNAAVVTVNVATQTVVATVGLAGSNVVATLLESGRNDGNPSGVYGGVTSMPVHYWPGPDKFAMFVRVGNWDAAVAQAVTYAVGTVSGGTSGTATAVRVRVTRLSAGEAVTLRVYGLTSTWDEVSSANPGTGALLGTIALGAGEGVYESTALAGLLTSPDRIHGVRLEPETVSTDSTYYLLGVHEWSDAAAPRFAFDVAVSSGSGVGGGAGGGSTSFSVGGDYKAEDWAPLMYVDVLEQARGFGATGTFEEDLAMPRDANGWPLGASQIVVTTAAERGAEYPTGVYKGRYVDQAAGSPATMTVVAISGSTVTNIVRTGNVVTFDWTVTAAPSLILSFSAGIKDARLVMPGYDPAAPSQIHRPEALAHWKVHAALRFLNMVGQNSMFEVTAASWAAREADNKRVGRPGWKRLIERFTEVHTAAGSKCKGFWVNVPYQFAEADHLAMAQFFAANLPVTACAYVECSNERWNGQYVTKWNYRLDKANNTAHVDYARLETPSTGGDQWIRLARSWALEDMRAARAWKQGFPGGFGTRVKPLMLAQHANPYWIDLMTTWATLPAQVAEFGAFASSIYAIGAAPYTGGETTEMAAPTSAAQFMDSLNGVAGAPFFSYSLPLLTTNLNPSLTGSMRGWKNRANSLGVKLIAYETGIHTHGGMTNQMAYDVHHLPSMQTHLTNLLHAQGGEGYELSMMLSSSVDTGVVSNINSFVWPIASAWTGAGYNTPKRLALSSVCAENP